MMVSRICAGLMLCAACCGGAFAQSHFEYVRPVSVSKPGQAYVVIDESILMRSRADLGDIRLFADSGREVQYVLRTQRGVRYSSWKQAIVLNQGLVAGDTQFTVDVGVPEYDCIEIALTAKDFVARATVEGTDDVAATTWNNLGSHSIYDFSKEKLGANRSIRLRTPSRYRYLRVTMAGGVKPEEVEGVNIANLREDKAQYVALSAQPQVTQRGNHTVASWNASDRLPVERIAVEVDPAEINFSRDASLFCDDRRVNDSHLSRVRMVRKGRQIESESLAIEPYGLRCKSYRIDIFNGDNPPLRISAVRPMMLERRIYFEPGSDIAFKLYYGDEKTGAPVYDYAKFFEPGDADTMVSAVLQAEVKNPGYSPWPDVRPFTERYPAVMWAAMLIAVGLLGAWAFKGFKS